MPARYALNIFTTNPEVRASLTDFTRSDRTNVLNDQKMVASVCGGHLAALFEAHFPTRKNPSLSPPDHDGSNPYEFQFGGRFSLKAAMPSSNSGSSSMAMTSVWAKAKDSPRPMSRMPRRPRRTARGRWRLRAGWKFVSQGQIVHTVNSFRPLPITVLEHS